MTTRLLEVPLCHHKWRDSKQECFDLVAKVTTRHRKNMAPPAWGGTLCSSVLFCFLFPSTLWEETLARVYVDCCSLVVPSDPRTLWGCTNLVAETRILSGNLKVRPRNAGSLSALLLTDKSVGEPRVSAGRGGIAYRPLSVHCTPRDLW